MRIQVAKVASNILQQRRLSLMNDASLPSSVRGMIGVHIDAAWIPNFWSVAIRAPKPGSEVYFDFFVGYAEDGTSWFFPSRQWWIAHAQSSHFPTGKGCDADIHTDFLSSEGKTHEFDYATVFLDGTIKILGRLDFVEECSWWMRAFGSELHNEQP
jgi:hypothetical protein